MSKPGQKFVSLKDYFSPTEKQMELVAALNTYSMIFYGGARGGGKTSGAVFVAFLLALQFPGIRICIMRKTLPELRDQIILNEILNKYPQTFYKYKSSEKTCVFLNGSTIFLRAAETEKDAEKEQGIERAVYILDEGNKFEWATIQKLRGSLRAPGIPNFKPTLIITGNPGGVCDREIKDRWINPKYERWNEEELAIKSEFKFIRSDSYDNPYLTDAYRSMLRSLPNALRKAWLEGSWDVFAGRFFDEWHEETHVVEYDQEFKIPPGWPRWRSIDLGYGDHPSVCLFLAQNPETGELFCYDEVATTKVTEIFLEMIMKASGDDYFLATFFDPRSMSGRKDTADQSSPKLMFLREGIVIKPAKTDRQDGWNNLRNWLHWSDEKPPMLKIFSRCRGLIETLPTMRYIDHKNDLNTKDLDDYVDALRYATSHIERGKVLTEDGYVEPGASLVDVPAYFNPGAGSDVLIDVEHRYGGKVVTDISSVYSPKYSSSQGSGRRSRSRINHGRY